MGWARALAKNPAPAAGHSLVLGLGHDRRERREKIIVEQLSSMADSTPDACKDNAAFEATYRFADNAAISTEAILDAHFHMVLRTRLDVVSTWDDAAR